jgi:hypothetical protein
MCVCVCVCVYIYIYRVIHKSLRDFRPLQYSSRDGHAEEEHVNRGRDTPKFLSYLTGIDMLSAVSVLVVAQPSSEVPEGLTNYPVYSVQLGPGDKGHCQGQCLLFSNDQ